MHEKAKNSIEPKGERATLSHKCCRPPPYARIYKCMRDCVYLARWFIYDEQPSLVMICRSSRINARAPALGQTQKLCKTHYFSQLKSRAAWIKWIAKSYEMENQTKVMLCLSIIQIRPMANDTSFVQFFFF